MAFEIITLGKICVLKDLSLSNEFQLMYNWIIQVAHSQKIPKYDENFVHCRRNFHLKIWPKSGKIANSLTLLQVWIVTGDKKETAINISRSCGHFRPNMTLLDLTGIESSGHAVRVMRQKINDENLVKPFCLIVDGKTVHTVFQDLNKEDTVPLLRNLSQECESVICCRMSPLQKAEIVAMIKGS